MWLVGAPGRFRCMAQVPLSRPKRNIARDFSDGVLVAETVQAYLYMERTNSVLCTPATTLFLLLLLFALLPAATIRSSSGSSSIWDTSTTPLPSQYVFTHVYIDICLYTRVYMHVYVYMIMYACVRIC